MPLTKDIERLLPVAVGSIAGTIANRTIAPYLTKYDVISKNKELISAVIILAGFYGRKLGGPRELWDGITVAGLVSLADNLAVRFGYDLI